MEFFVKATQLAVVVHLRVQQGGPRLAFSHVKTQCVDRARGGLTRSPFI